MEKMEEEMNILSECFLLQYKALPFQHIFPQKNNKRRNKQINSAYIRIA